MVESLSKKLQSDPTRSQHRADSSRTHGVAAETTRTSRPFPWTRRSRWNLPAGTLSLTARRWQVRAHHEVGTNPTRQPSAPTDRSSNSSSGKQSTRISATSAAALQASFSLSPNSQVCWEAGPSWNQTPTSTHHHSPTQPGFAGLLPARGKEAQLRGHREETEGCVTPQRALPESISLLWYAAQNSLHICILRSCRQKCYKGFCGIQELN